LEDIRPEPRSACSIRRLVDDASLISHLGRGRIAFLPDQLRVAEDGVYLVLKTGPTKIPGLDPQTFGSRTLLSLSSFPTLATI
jgi:hypothetical protein